MTVVQKVQASMNELARYIRLPGADKLRQKDGKLAMYRRKRLARIYREACQGRDPRRW